MQYKSASSFTKEINDCVLINTTYAPQEFEYEHKETPIWVLGKNDNLNFNPNIYFNKK